jgi:hypothetical protein
VHYHIPLHAQPFGAFETTSDHVTAVLGMLRDNPRLFPHLEIETYTWSVLPETLKAREVAEQIAGEYRWTLEQLSGLGPVANTTPGPGLH